MKHYLLNITWRCQLTCSYCWVRRSINTNPELTKAETRPAIDWARAIERDKPDILTMGGGEPLSVPWAIDLIRAFPNIKWSLSTNGIMVNKIMELAAQKLGQIININLSYHPESAQKYDWYFDQWRREIITLANAGYNVSSNVEKTGDNVKNSKQAIEWMKLQGLPMLISPICGGRPELAQPQPKPLLCEAGTNHLVIAPDGGAWPCQTAINSYAWRETYLGNWLDGELDMSKKPVPCHLWCVELYSQYKEHQAGDFFGINAREAE